MSLKKCILAMGLALLGTLTVVSAQTSEIKNYEVIIPPQFDSVMNFSDGYAAVKVDDKWGYINENGDFIIEPQFDYAGSFNEGKALCGNIAKEQKYEDLISWNLKIIDCEGNTIDLNYYDEGSNTICDYFVDFYMYEYNEEIQDYDPELIIDYKFNNGFVTFPACSEWGSNANWVFDTKGELFSRFCIRGMGQVFNEGLIVGDYIDYPHVLDKNKNEVLSFDYDNRIYYEGSEYIVDFLLAFSNNYTTAVVYAVDSGEQHIAIMDVNGNVKYMSERGFTPPRVRISGELGEIAISENIMGCYSNEGYWGAVDIDGNIRVPFIYDGMKICSEGLIGVQSNDLWGYVDTYGNVVIEPQYSLITRFKDGMALVVKDDTPYIIDRYNNVYANYEKISLSSYFLKDGAAFYLGDIITIYEDGKYGFAKFDYSVAYPQRNEMSDWAYDGVIESIENDLVPVYMRNNYSDKINRTEFATIIVNVLSQITGKDTEEIKNDLIKMSAKDFFESNPFKDTSDENVIIANKLGIISGVSHDTFNHAGDITREDASVMILRLAKYLNPDIVLNEVHFDDDQYISSYAEEAVGYVASNNIMKGVGNNSFSPKSNITREQAYIVALKALEVLR